MLISDWSSDVCSSDLVAILAEDAHGVASIDAERLHQRAELVGERNLDRMIGVAGVLQRFGNARRRHVERRVDAGIEGLDCRAVTGPHLADDGEGRREEIPYSRSEEHTSELQSLMRISYAVFCW